MYHIIKKNEKKILLCSSWKRDNYCDLKKKFDVDEVVYVDQSIILSLHKPMDTSGISILSDKNWAKKHMDYYVPLNQLVKPKFNDRQPIYGKDCLVYVATMFIFFFIWLIISLIVF